MAEERVQRRLAAILAADVVGYSRLMGADEAGTRARFNGHLRDLIQPTIAGHHGRIVKLMGDGLLVEFASVVDAVRCAVTIQNGMADRNTLETKDRRLDFRVGVNLGDVIVEGDDIHGDGVNIASRLEGLAEPGGLCVSGKVVDEVRNKLEFGFEDMGAHEVKNMAQPIRVYAVSPKKRSTGIAGNDGEVLPPPSKPSIAVLPFNNMSGDPEQEYFSDGITEDIITALSRFHSLFVIARNSSFAYKDRAVDVKQISAELGVRYVLEGSVRKAGTRVRITAQLVEGTTGAHLWAERYDRDLDAIFALQDEITENIVGAIEPEIGSSERKRAQRRPPERLDAWESYQRGMLHFYQFTRNGFTEARRFFKHAIELDPNFGSAHAALVINDGWAYNTGFIDSPEVLAEILRVAQRAVALDERDPLAYRALGLAYTSLDEHERAIAALEKAVDLNPNFADGFEMLGTALLRAGQIDVAIAPLETAIRLSPHSPELWQPMNLKAYCLLMLNQYEEAVEWARKSIRAFEARLPSEAVDAAPSDFQSPAWWPYAHLASALGHLGRADEGRAALDGMLLRQPDFSRDFFMRVARPPNPADLDVWFEGLRKAGWQE